MSLLTNWLESLGYELEISESCLRNISPFSRCNLCLDACPEHAIKIDKENVDISPDQCTSCGICITVCPEQAIKGQSPSRNVVQKNLLLEEDSPLPTVAELLYFHKKGIRYLCSASGNDKLDPVIRKANECLLKMGMESLESVCELTKVSDGQLKMSRRDFFSKLTSDSKKTMLSSITPAKWRFNEDNFRLSNLYPDWSFFDIVFDKEGCSLCEACFSLCPADVFKLEDKSLQVDAQKCSGCNLCRDICQSNGILIKKHLHQAATDHLQVFTSNCDICGNTFHSWNVEKVCHICSSRRVNDFFL